MKILQLCNKIPYPPIDGGAIAVLNMAVSLAKENHEVWILAMNTSKHSSDVSLIPEELRALIHFSYVPVDTRIKTTQLVLNLLFSRKPYNATRFHHAGFAARLEEILLSTGFDLVQLEGLYLKWFLPLIRKHHTGKIIYRAHNIESEIWEGIANSRKSFFERLYLKLLIRRIRNYEQDIIDKYDILLPISESDANTFRSMGNTKPLHITHTNIPDEGFLELNEVAKNPDLFYIGALDWIPNQEGLVWFINEVWEYLKKEMPSLEFHVAGRNVPDWLAEKCINSGCKFHGEVENAYQFFDQHTIMIVPLFSGSGLRIKIIEAMARSKVIISTQKGLQGIYPQAGKEILIEDDPIRMKQLIKTLVKDHALIKNIQTAAHDYALENFSSGYILNKLLFFYKQQGIC